MIPQTLAVLVVLARYGRMNRDRIAELAGPMCGGFVFNRTIYSVMGEVHGAGWVADARPPSWQRGGRGGRWYKITPAGRHELWRASQRAAVTLAVLRDVK